MTDITVVVGAQFGSEGKGAIAGHLCRNFDKWDTAIRVAGPNAGHTVYDSEHRSYALRSLPVAAVTSPYCQLHIAAGSEIDLEVLFSEIDLLTQAGFSVSDRLTIHPSATILTPADRAQESEAGLVDRIGSTGKGIGAARARRIMRHADTAMNIDVLAPWMSDPGPFDLRDTRQVLIEGTQGYGLGLHTDFYPQTTSSDCRAIDFLAMAGISPWSDRVQNMNVVLVARTYPIRVAGNSGPLLGETTWAELNLPEERTTVTKKVRRVGQWDSALVEEAVTANGGGAFDSNVCLALTMLDQRFPEIKGATLTPQIPSNILEFVDNIEYEIMATVGYLGTGPETVVQL